MSREEGGGNARSERGAKMMRGSGVDLHVGGHGQIWMDGWMDRGES